MSVPFLFSLLLLSGVKTRVCTQLRNVCNRDCHSVLPQSQHADLFPHLEEAFAALASSDAVVLTSGVVPANGAKLALIDWLMRRVRMKLRLSVNAQKRPKTTCKTFAFKAVESAKFSVVACKYNPENADVNISATN